MLMVKQSEKVSKRKIKRKLLPLLMVAVLFTLSLPMIPVKAVSASDGVVTYRAVIIGNTYAGTKDELNGPQYCADSMEDMLKTLKVPYAEVTKILNSTKKDMEKAVAKIFSKADGDDLTLFYYSGHGAVAAKDSFSSQQFYDGALCFLDKSGNGIDYYAVSELKVLFDKYKGKKALILDCCGSGAFVQTQGLSVDKSTDNDPHMIRTDAEEEGFLENVAGIFSEGAYAKEDESLPKAMSGEFRDSDYYLICASKKGEYSYLIPVNRNGSHYYGGVMTIGLLEGTGYEYMTGWTDSMPADSDLDSCITLKEGYTYAQKIADELLTERYGYEQKLVCYPSGSKQVFFDNNDPVITEVLPVYRVYNPNSSEHFLTYDEKERDFLLKLGWNDEGTAFSCYSEGKEDNAVYRLYNTGGGGEHFYTSDASERDSLKSIGWSDEGIAWYSSSEKDANPVFRFYNNSLGRHMYTVDFVEFVNLTMSGWNYEGTPFGSPKK